jgi:hypothetical protein
MGLFSEKLFRKPIGFLLVACNVGPYQVGWPIRASLGLGADARQLQNALFLSTVDALVAASIHDVCP